MWGCVSLLGLPCRMRGLPLSHSGAPLTCPPLPTHMLLFWGGVHSSLRPSRSLRFPGALPVAGSVVCMGPAQGRPGARRPIGVSPMAGVPRGMRPGRATWHPTGSLPLAVPQKQVTRSGCLAMGGMLWSRPLGAARRLAARGVIANGEGSSGPDSRAAQAPGFLFFLPGHRAREDLAAADGRRHNDMAPSPFFSRNRKREKKGSLDSPGFHRAAA